MAAIDSSKRDKSFFEFTRFRMSCSSRSIIGMTSRNSPVSRTITQLQSALEEQLMNMYEPMLGGGELTRARGTYG